MFNAEDKGDQGGSRDVFKAGVQGVDEVLFKTGTGKVFKVVQGGDKVLFKLLGGGLN